jgi:DNA-binding LytR/AlgR family response regulator
MIKAIAIDDEPLALNIISHFCHITGKVCLEKSFTKQTEALKYLNKFPVDLIFLDINMPNKNGIDFYKELKNKPLLILTTAYSEFALEGFNINTTDYLLKPFSEERFVQAIEKVCKQLKLIKDTAIQTHLSIRADYKLHRIEFDNIAFIEGMSLKYILEKLPENDFIRVHRSYIIPLKKVSSIQSKSLQIGEFTIPIGNTYKDLISNLFNK